MAFVLDCSVALVWCFEDEVDQYANWVFGLLETVERIVVPPLWPTELANALLVRERKNRLSRPESVRFLKTLEAFPIELDTRSSYQTVHEVLDYGRDCGISAYDAAYLECAIRLGLPLATLDKALRRAAIKVGAQELRPESSLEPAS